MTRSKPKLSLIVVFSSISSISSILCILSYASSAAGESVEAADEAQLRYSRGSELAESGEIEAALVEFLRSYELAPHPTLLYPIGQIYQALERFPEAVRAYGRFLGESGEEVMPELRADAERQMAAVLGRVGRLRINVEHPSSAVVLVDGDEVAQGALAAPLVLTTGPHRVEVRAEEFSPFIGESVLEGGQLVELEVSLEPLATLTLMVSTVGATVHCDGEEVGITPLEEPLLVTPGSHVVEVFRPGYHRGRATFEVSAGAQSRVVLTLRPLAELPADLAGELDVQVSEEESQISLDGAPLTIGIVPVGPHLLEVRREGFEPWSQQVDVVGGVPSQVEAILEPTEEFRDRYESRSRALRIAAYVLLGLGGAGLATTLGLSVWNNGRDGDWQTENERLLEQIEDRPTDEVWRQVQTNNELGHSIVNAEIATWSVLGTGLALVGAAMCLLFLGPDPQRYEALLSQRSGGLQLSSSMSRRGGSR